MKKTLLTIALVAATTSVAWSQTALDAYQLSQGDLRGTARFMSMGGAFTALGGDLTTLGQNPAGIGVYRFSEIGATMDINPQTINTGSYSTSQTSVTCPMVGYIGSMNLGANSAMPWFNWGISYSRAASFNRKYTGSIGGINSSLSNYVAGYTASEGWAPKQLDGYGSTNPYQNTWAPWMSILLYNCYAINPSSTESTDYQGLYNGTAGQATFDVVESGYVDEYEINFGGNVNNTVYWGLGFGITDIEYQNTTYYTESFSDATISTPDAKGRTTGTASYGIESYKHVSGSGFNFKVGLILKPVNELRIGFAVHTPTYYNLNYNAWAQTNYAYTYPTLKDQEDLKGYYPTTNTYGADDFFRWKLRSPWRLMAGVAAVLGRQAIVSVDYEYRPYQSMNVQDDQGVGYNDVNSDVKLYYKSQNIIRVGAEYRLTPSWSLRAGYSYASSPVTDGAANGNYTMYTSGPDDTETQASYILDKSTQYITCGIGWHYKNFYADAAYVHRYRQSEWHAFTNYSSDGTDWVEAPKASLSDRQNHVVLSLGFKF